MRDYITELYWGCNKRVVLLGHSKGGLDSAAALSIYQHELEDKVVGLVVAQSPYGGTPIASDIMRRGQLVDEHWRWMLEMAMKRIFKVPVLRMWDLNRLVFRGMGFEHMGFKGMGFERMGFKHMGFECMSFKGMGFE